MLPAAAQLNLPQFDASAEFPEETRTTLEPLLRRAAAEGTAVLSLEAERQVIGLLPAELRDACPRMISHWGEVAQGTARWSLRVLQWRPSPDALAALLAFRCGSSLPDYAEAYDERLGLLRFTLDTAQMKLIPIAEDCDNCSDLFRLEFSRAFPLPEGELAELAVTASSENPCCGGPSAWREERLLYVALPEASVALSVVRQSERYEHDDVEGDWEEICGSHVMDTTVDERLIDLTLHTTCRINGEKSKQEVQSHRWNPELRSFVSLPPTQP
jgi:hypothetical protein